MKATEAIFKRRVITCKSGITHEKNIDLKIESAAVKQFGHGLFDDTDHFFEHHIGQERDHIFTDENYRKRYLHLRLKTYGKRYKNDCTQKPAIK